MALPPFRPTLLAAAFAVAAALPRPALAAPPRSQSLGWTRLRGAESCIGTRDLAEAVEARLGRQAFVSAARADVAVEGSIEGPVEGDLAPAWRALIKITDEHGAVLGTRELRSEAATCRALDDELALVIALMIDPDAAVHGALPPPPPSVAAPPTPAPVVVPLWLPPPSNLPPPPVPWRAGAFAGAVFSLGLLPNVGAGVEVRGRIGPPHWPVLELGGVFWFPNSAEGSGLGTRFILAEGVLGLCPLATSTLGVDLAACAAVRAGVLHAGGFGVPTSFDHERFTLAPAVTGHVRRRIAGPLALDVGFAVLAPIFRDRFYFAEPGAQKIEVFRMSQLAGSLEVGLGVTLP